MWPSPRDKCVLQQCVRGKDEVFISETNVSCPNLGPPSCPLGTELRCDMQGCCPLCRCGKHTHAIRQKTKSFSLVLQCSYVKLQLQYLASRWCQMAPTVIFSVSVMNVNKMTCAFFHAAPLNACVLNHTVIGVSHAEKQHYSSVLEHLNDDFSCFISRVFAQAGEMLMVDVCTRCECQVEDGAVKRPRLSCRKTTCPSCPMVIITPFHYF